MREDACSKHFTVLEVLHRERPAFWDFLGIDILDARGGYAKLCLRCDGRFTNPYGLVNGGFLAVLADTAMASALLTVTKDTPTRRLVSIEFKVNNIRPVRGGVVVAEARVIHLGRSIAFGEVDLYDDSEKLVGKSLMTYSIRQ